MTEALNPSAPHHLPFFVTAPGQTDVLLVAMLILLLAIVLFVGNLYFQLHSLPERIAHGVNHVQMQVVGVLCLLALFTHNHVFWIAALLLALLELPDFSTPMNSIARSLERLAGTTEVTQSPASSDHQPRVSEPPAIGMDEVPTKVPSANAAASAASVALAKGAQATSEFLNDVLTKARERLLNRKP
jgi:multisubunit Na+/H+ antiporter MnhF subunit